MGYLARYVIDVLRHPRVITPIVAPKCFCDHEVVMKTLRCVCVECGFVVVACLSFVVRPLVGWCIQCGRWLLHSALLGQLDDVVHNC
jgi:hypothetical protein